MSSGSLIYSIATYATFAISSSTFKCKTTAYTTNEPSLSGMVSTIGGAFYIYGAWGGVTSTLNTYKNCYLGDKGGVFYLESTSFSDTGGSTFSYNAAVYGGAINCKSCYMTFKSTTFTNH